jgi:hypothetical protein
MGIPDAHSSTSTSSWTPQTLSGDLPAHRPGPNSVRESNFQNIINLPDFDGVRGTNLSQANLDVLATASGLQAPIHPTRAVSSFGHGYTSNISSSLASPVRLDYNGIGVQQSLDDQTLLENLDKVRARYRIANDEERKKILELLGPEVLAGREMDRDDGSSGSSPDPLVRKTAVCTKCGKCFEKKASLK